MSERTEFAENVPRKAMVIARAYVMQESVKC